MTTRADFYVGVGPQAEWLGSIASDGYPSGVSAEPEDEEKVRAQYSGSAYLRPSDIEELVQSERASAFGQHILQEQDEAKYRQLVKSFVEARPDGTLPSHGWPWPWDTSATTDYAYFLFEGKVLASSFGGPLFDPLGEEPNEENDAKPVGALPKLPDMSSRKNVRWDKGSGVIVMGN